MNSKKKKSYPDDDVQFAVNSSALCPRLWGVHAGTEKKKKYLKLIYIEIVY
jgi:hypothetical protein